MKLSALERMLKEVDLSLDAARFLLNCGCECEWLDYKSQLTLDNDKAVADFARDILALKNMGGGYIVVGVEDRTWKPVGIPARLSYDSKQLIDKVRKASGVDLEVAIVHHALQIAGESRIFALIHVRSSSKRNKRRVPTLAKRDFHPNESWGLRTGDIFVRRGDSTERIKLESELENILDRLETQADEEMVEGSGRPSPFAVEVGLYRLLEKGYSTFVGRGDLRTEVIAAVTKDPRIWIVNVHGPGGVGKSAIVNWATYEFYDGRAGEFESIIQLSARETVLTETGIRPWGRTLHSLEDLLDRILTTFEEQPPTGLEQKRTLAVEILSAWNTLLVLDNMETVSDGRIFDFLRSLPPTSKTKVLLTSRERTGGWELAVPVRELNLAETTEFLAVKSAEMQAEFPLSQDTCRRVLEISGGLPLAIQWIIGKYKLERNIDKVLNLVQSKDSPVLEFSFRNIWRSLSGEAQAILAVLTIFDAPPAIQQIAIATDWTAERIERSLLELADVTLVTRTTQPADGRVVYVALPITLRFAKHQLSEMGDFEAKCRQRLQRFMEQMDLQKSEIRGFVSDFERYGIDTDNEKRAAILCKRGQSEMFSGNADNADMMFRQARELAPQSSYVLAMSASYELARNRVGLALDFAQKGCKLSTKKTKTLCFRILARVFWVMGNRRERVAALRTALEFEPDNVVLEHEYGVALSWAGKSQEAIEIFTNIITDERDKIPPRDQLLFALKTKIINLLRLERYPEAVRDYDYAREILAANPHLSEQVRRHIEEMEEEIAPHRRTC